MLPQAILLVAALALADGCGGGGGSGSDGGGARPPPSNRADFLIGAGLVHAWPNHAREIVDANADAGLTFTEIEWVTEGNTAPCPAGSRLPADLFATFPAAAAELVDEARKRDVTVFIDIANANNCAVMSQPDSWFVDQVGQVVALGLDHVLISPVSEPGASPAKAAHWLTITRQWVPPDHLVDIPINGAPPAAFTDVHFCDPEKMLRALNRGEPAIIHSTDCGTILDPGPTFAAELATAANGTKSPLIIYDNRSKDMTTLQATTTAMGEAIQ
jgi:hypothetical protein